MLELNRKKRQIKILIFFTIIFLLLISRIYYLTNIKGEKLSILTDSQYKYEEKTNELKYEMIDSNGSSLLNYYYKYYLVINPQLFRNNFNESNGDFKTLYYVLKGNFSPIDIYDEKIISSNTLLKFSLDEKSFQKLAYLNKIKGMYYYGEKVVDRRDAWKIENIISNYYDNSNKPKDKSSLEGIIYDKYNNSLYDKISFGRDEEGYIKIIEEIKGSNCLILTLNNDLQMGIRSILKETPYSQVGCILMESSTGNIISLAQKDEKKPNILIGANSEEIIPGSTFKILIEEVALEKNIINERTKFTCLGSLEKNDHKYHGTMEIKKALTISCNDIFSQIGRKTGFDNIKEMAEKQGLLTKGINLYDEGTGYFGNEKEIGLTSIGQNIYVTPISLVSSLNIIANKGYYIYPNIIQGNVTKKVKILSDKTVNILEDSLRSVVVSGTGIRANNSSVKVYGKTGTTEYIIKGISKSDGIFLGYFKILEKNYSMIVLVKDIDKEKEDGGNTAATIFNNILNLLIKEIPKVIKN